MSTLSPDDFQGMEPSQLGFSADVVLASAAVAAFPMIVSDPIL